MTNTTLKRKFREALIARKAEGFEIVTESYFYPGLKCCCAVGAVLNRQVDFNPRLSPEAELAVKIKASELKIVAIESGFCDWSVEAIKPENMSLYRYGQKLAKEFLD